MRDCGGAPLERWVGAGGGVAGQRGLLRVWGIRGLSAQSESKGEGRA
eukprot:COSAG02_NODE_1579_length_11851_cov_12.490343_6_plen_47_part_00